MNTTILSSTFLLTLLLAVGLIFFIRASVKERIEQVNLMAEQPEDSLFTELQQYFTHRAYQINTVDAVNHQVTFQGFVRPSWFLAIFLTLLAACGLLCLGLILSFLYPASGNLFLGLVLLAPGAGWFYWKKAGRIEQVSLKVEAIPTSQTGAQSRVSVTAHRDELSALQQALPLKRLE